MEVNCPACHQGLRVDDQNVGKQARCPKCGTIFQIVAPAPPRERIQTSDSRHVETNLLESAPAFGPNSSHSPNIATASSNSMSNATASSVLNSGSSLSQSQVYGAVVPPPFPSDSPNQIEVKSFAAATPIPSPSQATPVSFPSPNNSPTQNPIQNHNRTPVQNHSPVQNHTRASDREVLYISDDTPMPTSRAPSNMNTSVSEEWLLRLPNGNEYGPVSRFVMQQWVNERRVVGDHLIRMVNGKWVPARYVFPELREDQQARPAPNNLGSRAPNRGWQGNGVRSQASVHSTDARLNNYAARTPRQSLAWLGILLGIIGFFFFPIAIIGLVVSINDLSAIQRGDLSREHKANTVLAAILCGIAVAMSFFVLIAILK